MPSLPLQSGSGVRQAAVSEFMERAVGLEPMTLCLGNGEPLSAPETSFRIWRRTVSQSKQMVARYPFAIIIA